MSGRVALSRRLSSSVGSSDTSASASQAIRLSPSDPKAYYVRGLSKRDRIAEAVKDFETAVALRPDDHLFWLWLGYARDRVGDQEGALAAYQESARLAPHYAQPRWYLGRLLLRAERRDEAFAELRHAAASNPRFLINAISRAWRVYRDDTRAVEQAIQPETPGARLTLARYFVQHGYATEGMELFRSTSGTSGKDRRALLDALLTAKRFTEAYEVWVSGRDAGSRENRSGIAAITDGSFESDISLDDPGFGWQLARDLQAMRVSLDANQPHSGASSMRLSWTGDSNPSTPVVSQIVLIEPNTHYRLTWAVRTEELLTIGLPIVTVSDASSDKERVPLQLLTQSKPVPTGTSGWQDYSIDFTTDESTRAVLIAIRRQPCAMAPCAAIGHVWVDDFSIAKLE